MDDIAKVIGDARDKLKLLQSDIGSVEHVHSSLLEAAVKLTDSLTKLIARATESQNEIQKKQEAEGFNPDTKKQYYNVK